MCSARWLVALLWRKIQSKLFHIYYNLELPVIRTYKKSKDLLFTRNIYFTP